VYRGGRPERAVKVWEGARAVWRCADGKVIIFGTLTESLTRPDKKTRHPYHGRREKRREVTRTNEGQSRTVMRGGGNNDEEQSQTVMRGGWRQQYWQNEQNQKTPGTRMRGTGRKNSSFGGGCACAGGRDISRPNLPHTSLFHRLFSSLFLRRILTNYSCGRGGAEFFCLTL